MKTVLVIIALLAVSITAGQVYAERSTVEVPFDFTGSSCTFDELSVIYTCRWEGSTETITSEGKTDAGVVPPEQLTEERKAAHDLAIADKIETKLSSTERLIKQLEVKIENQSISSADRILYELLVDMKESCELGIEHGALIQKYKQFELPVSDPRTAYKAIDFGKNIKLGDIIMKIEECKGWDEYRETHLGQRYLDLIVDDSTSQSHHRDMVMDKKTYPTDKITKQTFLDTQKKANDFICKASFYDADFKKARGCFNVPEEKYPDIVDDTFKKNRAYRNYVEYMSAGTVDMTTLMKQEVEKSQHQSLETFALLHGIDLAELKNLVQGVDEYNEAQKP